MRRGWPAGRLAARRGAALRFRTGLLSLVVSTLAGCASGPPVPDWALAARGASERLVAASLQGPVRVEVLEAERLRRELGRTADPVRVARGALLVCALQQARLDLTDCPAFEALRAEASPADRAYADYLQGRPVAGADALLPEAHRALARRLASGPALTAADLPLLAAIEDPLARLLAAAVWMRAGQGHPAVVAMAVDTASAQGWSRPLAAWLGAQQRLAERAGDTDTARRAARRLGLLTGAAR